MFKILLPIILILSLDTAFGKDQSVSELKAEIKRLQNKVNELNVQVGDLEMALDDTQAELTKKPLVVVRTKLQPYPQYKTTRLSVLAGAQSSNDDIIGGVQLQKMLTTRFNVGGQFQTNKTVLLNLGFDF